jgi:hypothetical protein
MKRVLLDFRGVVNDIVEVGSEFEVYDGPDTSIKWVLCHNDEVDQKWHCQDGEWISPDRKLDVNYDMQRQIAYGTIHEQLGMLYHDIKNGNLENGNWITMQDNVKQNIISQKQFTADPANFENTVTLKYHTKEDPAWNYLPAKDTTPPTFDHLKN